MEDSLDMMINLAREKGASYAEARYQNDEYESNLLKNGQPEVSTFETRKGISFRVVYDGALGFGSTNQMSRSRLKSLVLKTVATAKSSSRLRKSPLGMGQAEMGQSVVEITPRVPFFSISLESRIELLKEADSAAVRMAEKCSALLAGRYVSLDTLTTERMVINSDGGRVHSRIPRVAVDVMLTAYQDQRGTAQRIFSIGESAGWESVERWDLPTRLESEVKALCSVLSKAEKMDAGTYDVILGQEVVGIVSHESAGHPGEADRILGREGAQAGETYLGQSDLGRQVGSEVVNVVDDPTIPKSFGFYLHDEEGVKARRRYLIKEGKVNEFLQNRETAYFMGTQSNAASRSVAFNREPIVRMANTFVEPKDHSFEELKEDIQQGVYIKNFMEWNIDDRRFNQRYVGLEAYKIENGELKGLVKNPILEITTPALWSAVDAVGNDLQFSAAYCGKGDPMQGIPVWTGGPHMRLRNVRLGGSA